MNEHITHSLRRHINLFSIYRILLCCIAAVSITVASALWLSDYFSPLNMETRTVEGQSLLCLPLTLREDEEMDPVNESLLKQEIYFTEENNKQPNSEIAGGDDGVFPITHTDMSQGASKGEVLVRDSDSGISVDTQKLLYSPWPSALQKEKFSSIGTIDEPLVLILHTHATESYTAEGSVSYSTDTDFRSEDCNKNVVSVGKVMTDTLNSMGVPTVHCTILHDKDNYNDSYNASLATIQSYLEKYPSIKYVFDVHRDAIIKDNGEALKPTCTINGKSTAQIMILVGTDAGGAAHPDWQTNNMTLAVKLQNLLTQEYNGMARPINTRRLSFHQQYAPGSLLFEIGSCANTLNEAKNAAVNLAAALAQLINMS